MLLADLPSRLRLQEYMKRAAAQAGGEVEAGLRPLEVLSCALLEAERGAPCTLDTYAPVYCAWSWGAEDDARVVRWFDGLNTWGSLPLSVKASARIQCEMGTGASQ
ncbi:hypothetical protein CYMTET_14238 [Cymbomonas tetramitiformis]|uniref:Uncharacterized protein n=1 Tax=Cymbomonas tetramitiformis TaxID=36881 RepID=A0AAE0GGR3_9CHLO|nr:hypothetical protein CYMTET_14238 [Cymbomonas tetramitiformis]